MSIIEVPVTAELEPYAADIRYFMETMVRKLHTNRHKGFAAAEMTVLRRGLMDEIEELEKSLNYVGQFESMVEAADVANMALLIAVKVLRMTRKEFNGDCAISSHA